VRPCPPLIDPHRQGIPPLNSLPLCVSWRTLIEACVKCHQSQGKFQRHSLVRVNKTQFAIRPVFGPGYWLARVPVLYRQDNRCYGQVSTEEPRGRYAAQSRVDEDTDQADSNESTARMPIDVDHTLCVNQFPPLRSSRIDMMSKLYIKRTHD
jgi:hypothetical protein